MKQLEDLLTSTPEMSMKHYEALKTDPRAIEMNNLASKEASYIGAVGYVPRADMRAQDFEDMVQRNEVSKARGGLYVQKADPVRNMTLT